MILFLDSEIHDGGVQVHVGRRPVINEVGRELQIAVLGHLKRLSVLGDGHLGAGDAEDRNAGRRERAGRNVASHRA